MNAWRSTTPMTVPNVPIDTTATFRKAYTQRKTQKKNTEEKKQEQEQKEENKYKFAIIVDTEIKKKNKSNLTYND